MTKVREANKTELAMLQRYYKNLQGTTKEEFDVSNYDVVVMPNYISESPGYVGKLIFCVFAFPSYHVVFKIINNQLIEVERDTT